MTGTGSKIQGGGRMPLSHSVCRTFFFAFPDSNFPFEILKKQKLEACVSTNINKSFRTLTTTKLRTSQCPRIYREGGVDWARGCSNMQNPTLNLESYCPRSL